MGLLAALSAPLSRPLRPAHGNVAVRRQHVITSAQVTSAFFGSMTVRGSVSRLPRSMTPPAWPAVRQDGAAQNKARRQGSGAAEDL